MSGKKKNKRTLEIPNEITDALSVPPVEYLRKWWMSNSTLEERTAADDRDATIEGAYAFVEDFARRAKHESGVCLPDQMVYDLAGIFMRVCVDGDVYATSEEIEKDEREEREREEREAKRKEEAARRMEEAERKEAERIASLSPEEREIYEREKAERAEKDEQRKAEEAARRAAQEAIDKAKREKREAAERKKALAEEMEKRQMTFFE